MVSKNLSLSQEQKMTSVVCEKEKSKELSKTDMEIKMAARTTAPRIVGFDHKECFLSAGVEKFPIFAVCCSTKFVCPITAFCRSSRRILYR
jgi:hypothetical protein